MKMLKLDGDGIPITERTRELTPHPATPDAVLQTLSQMARAHEPFQRIALGFPGVVKHGTVLTAPNLGTELWRSFALDRAIADLTGRPTLVINDADLQGYGVIAGRGVEMVLTLGTGLGASLFVEGHLVPNLELGHHPFKKRATYEQRVSDRERRRIGNRRWSRRVLEVLDVLGPIFNYDALHLGGGNARKLKVPLPDTVRLFQSSEGLRGGLRLWQDADPARAERRLWQKADS